MPELKRGLGLGYATLFGVGLILGAGVYVLIGRAAGIAGDAVWASVAFSGLIAVSTALSFAELAGVFPYASSTHRYVAEAFPRRRLLAFLAGCCSSEGSLERRLRPWASLATFAG
jgi:amino acid transporter